MIRSSKEIENQLVKAQEWALNRQTAVGGMTYEDGVESALKWVLGEEDAEPIETDFGEEE